MRVSGFWFEVSGRVEGLGLRVWGDFGIRDLGVRGTQRSLHDPLYYLVVGVGFRAQD